MDARYESALAGMRQIIRSNKFSDEAGIIRSLYEGCDLSPNDRRDISNRAASLVERLRENSSQGILQSFLTEYGLSTDEGVALMCLAEALLRVPDTDTIDALISDKLASSNWDRHLGHSTSTFVNASTWALMLTGRVLSQEEDHSILNQLHQVVRRLGEPVVRVAVGQAIKELGQQFVLGQTIEEATKRAKKYESIGCTFSYDMLGESAHNERDARKYHLAYSRTITALAELCTSEHIQENPGISVKLSALHPRYEYQQRELVLEDIVARCISLAQLAKSSNMGFNIDAEESDRLELSLDVIERLLTDQSLANWNGFGIVVQAYGKRAGAVLDWLYSMAKILDRKIMVRLVKGAYWDTEIKQSQVVGHPGYPVFTRKTNTDISYLANSRKLFDMRNHIYPQFATHNAHTVETILHYSRTTGADPAGEFEFQRLHGMGEALYNSVISDYGVKCRIYAPVGTHEDLLAYLVRRLLENGANSSFVNQITDGTVSPEQVAADPLTMHEEHHERISNPMIVAPKDIFGSSRKGSRGWDLSDPQEVDYLLKERERYRDTQWQSQPVVGAKIDSNGSERTIFNPALPSEIVGSVVEAEPEQIELAIETAVDNRAAWQSCSTEKRAKLLERIGNCYEEHCHELFALMAREAGKCLPDCVAELREAVDFCRYYAAESHRFESWEQLKPRGVIACISPWNFPLAIFTGQIVGALAAGNTVIAKPAEQTPLIASKAVELMAMAGIPDGVIQLLPGDGPNVGAKLIEDRRLDGVCFTGSTLTAQSINRSMAKFMNPDAPLIAETGGLNAMIVDSSALPEQAVRDIVASSFQSAGQRCSALRLLYVQNEVKNRITDMLYGAMDALTVGDPWKFSSDLGPVIDRQSAEDLQEYCEANRKNGSLKKQTSIGELAEVGYFVPPTVIEVGGIEELEREIFGPVLHVATFDSGRIDEVIEAINSKGYGLTFGMHTRVEQRIEQVIEKIDAGNIYVNRNQIGAVVESQPFGGGGLSGTGPKAGGPNYVGRFLTNGDDPTSREIVLSDPTTSNIREDIAQKNARKVGSWLDSGKVDIPAAIQAWVESKFGHLSGVVSDLEKKITAFSKVPFDLPGPTGEGNQLWYVSRKPFVVLGTSGCEDPDTTVLQSVAAMIAGNGVLAISPVGNCDIGSPLEEFRIPLIWMDGSPDSKLLNKLAGIGGVVAFGSPDDLRVWRISLAQREGPILPLISDFLHLDRFFQEKALCIDTTASGGNTKLLAAESE